MFTERQAIQDELNDNRRMMMEMRSRNMDLIKRLREIDERDMKDDVSYDGLNTLTQSLTEILGKLTDLVPSVSPQDIINQAMEQIQTNEVKLEVPGEEEKETTKIEAAAQKAKIESAPAPFLISKERQATVIKEIIAEFGVIRTKHIEEEFYKRTGRKYANFGEQLRNAMEITPSIIKAGRGRYTLSDIHKDDKENRNEVMAAFKVERKEKWAAQEKDNNDEVILS